MAGDDLSAWIGERLAALDQQPVPAPVRPPRAVVGFDGTETAQAAARWAGRIAGEVHLVAALPSGQNEPQGPIKRGEAEHWAGGVRARLPEALRSISQELTDVSIELHEMDAEPGPAITEMTDRIEAGLLAIGTGRKGTLDRLVLGSVGESLIKDADVPTLLARTAPRDGPIVVGLGRDPGTPYAAAWAVHLAEALEQPLRLAHAPERGPAPDAFPGRQGPHMATLVDAPPADGLTGLANQEDADLIVVGHEPGVRFGSTAVQMLRQAPCSVLVARPIADRQGVSD